MEAVHHIVMWRLNGVTNDERTEQADRIVQAFESLRGHVPGLLRMEVGVNVIDAVDAWDLALSMVFASVDDLKAYNAHPRHLEIKSLVAPLRAARCQVDFRVAP